jgi:SulP family sulfate permease
MPLLVFMTAALLLAGAFFRVADLTQYISRTVVIAYVTGAAHAHHRQPAPLVPSASP